MMTKRSLGDNPNSLKIDNIGSDLSYNIQAIARNYVVDSPPAEVFVVSEIIDVP